jgi:hypothetical protein
MTMDETDRHGRGGDLAEAVLATEAVVTALLHTRRGEGLPPVLETVVQRAVDAVPGACSAAMLVLDHRRRPAERAASDPTAAELDDLQIALGEGPTLDAADSSTVTTELDLHRSAAWPRWAPSAARGGVAGVVAVPCGSGHARGVLTLYAPADGVEPLSAPMARMVACVAGMAVMSAVDVHGLTRALESRDTIGQAKGILMERLGLDRNRAFAMLAEASQATNVKLREVAAEVARSPVETPADTAAGDCSARAAG